MTPDYTTHGLNFKSKTQNHGQIHDDGILCMKLSADESHLFTANAELKQWNIAGQKIEHCYGAPHALPIQAIEITLDCKFIFTASRGKTLKQFDITKKQLYRDFGEIHSSPVNCLALTPDQGSLFTADSQQNLKQWDLKTGSLVNNFGDVFEIKIRSLQVTIDGCYLYNGGFGQVSKFDLQDKRIVEKGFTVNSGVFCMVLSNNGKYLAYASMGKLLRVVVLEEGDAGVLLDSQEKCWVKCIGFSKDDEYLFSGDDEGVLKQWSVSGGVLVRKWGRTSEGWLECMAVGVFRGAKELVKGRCF